MNIAYVQPLKQAWARMVRMLFRPFALGKWFVLGFAAFLSEGIARPWGGTRYSFRDHGGGMPVAAATVLRHIAVFLAHPVWGALIIVGLTLACIAILVLMWVNSRGRFVFLDNVVRERPAIVEPWRRYRRHGNALFVFSVVSHIAWGAAALAIVLPMLPTLLEAAAGGHWKALALMAIGGTLVLLIPLAIVAAYFFLCLRHFIVPLMLRDDIGVLAAWSRFLQLFARHPLHFIAFGVFYLVLAMVVITAAITVGLATCCIGFALMVTPYIGSVVMLPVEVVFRGLGPEFLAQFGPEYSVFVAPAQGPAA